MTNGIDPRDIQALARAQDETQAKEKLQREQNEDDIRWLMSTAQGRRIMARLLHVTGTQRSSFTGNSTTFFNEGARSIGLLYTEEVLRIAPDDYLKMLKEQRQ